MKPSGGLSPRPQAGTSSVRTPRFGCGRTAAGMCRSQELTLVINRHGEIVGYCAGNDVSSRDIEGENPLYLPQAKVYNGSSVLGPAIILADANSLRDLSIGLTIVRGGQTVFEGETRTSRMKRSFEDLAAYLYRELEFPAARSS